MIIFTVITLSLSYIVSCEETGPQSSSMDITAINSLVRRPQVHLDPRLRKALLRVLTRLDQEDKIENSSDNYHQVVTQEDFMSFFQKEKPDSEQQLNEQNPVMTEVLPTPQNQNVKTSKSFVDEKIFDSEHSLKNINVFGLKTHQSSINEIPTTDHVKNGFFFRLPFANNTSSQNSTVAETFTSEESQNIRDANLKNSLSNTLNSHEAVKNSHTHAHTSHTTTQLDTPFRNSLKNALKSPEIFMSSHMSLHAQNSPDTSSKNTVTNSQNNNEALKNSPNTQNNNEALKNSPNAQNNNEENVKSVFLDPENINSLNNNHEASKNSPNTQNNHETLKNSLPTQNSNEENVKTVFLDPENINNLRNSHEASKNSPSTQHNHEALKKSLPTQNSHEEHVRNVFLDPENINNLRNYQKSHEANHKHSFENKQQSHEAFKTILNAENINNLRTNQNSQETNLKNSFENTQNSQEENFKASFLNPETINNLRNNQNSHELNTNNNFQSSHNSKDGNFNNFFPGQKPEPIEIVRPDPVITEELLSKSSQKARVVLQQLQKSRETQENKHSRDTENPTQISKEEAINMEKEEIEKEEKQEKEGNFEENSSKSNDTGNPELKLDGKVEFSEAPLVVAFTVQQDSRGHPHRVIPLSYRRPGEAPPSSAPTDDIKATPVTKLSDPSEINFYKSLTQTSSLFKQNPNLASSGPFAAIDRPFAPSNDLPRVNGQFVKSQSEIIPAQNYIATQQALQPINNPQFVQQVLAVPTVNFAPAPTNPQQVTSFEFVPSVVKQDGFVPFQPQKQTFFEPKYQQNFIGSNELVQPVRYSQQSFIANNDLSPPVRSNDDRRRFPVRSQNFEFQRSVDVPQSNFFQRRPHHQNFFPQQQPELNRVNRKEPNQFVGNFGFNQQHRFNHNSQYQFQPPTQVPLDNQLRHLFYQSGIDNSQRFSGGAEDLNIVTKVLALNHVGRNDLSEQSFSETSRNQVKVRPPSRVIEPPFE